MHGLFGCFHTNLYNCVGETGRQHPRNRHRRETPQWHNRRLRLANRRDNHRLNRPGQTSHRHSQPRRRESRPVRWANRRPNCRPQCSRHGAYGQGSVRKPSSWPTVVVTGGAHGAFEATFGSLATIMRGRGFLEKRTSHPIIYTLFAKRGRIMVNYHVDNILYLAREQQLYRWSLSGVA